MRVLIVLGLALLLTVPVPQCFAAASGREAPPVPDGHGGGADAALAPTLPPVGFVEFCARNPWAPPVCPKCAAVALILETAGN